MPDAIRKTAAQMNDEAVSLVPEAGEIDYDEYKAQLYAANPEDGKAVLQKLMLKNTFKLRLDHSVKPAKVYLSRKS